MELLIILGFFVLMMWFFGRQQKKAMAKMADRRQEALVIGNTVQTNSGMIGKIVDIDGGVITLESASGDETQWLDQAIASVIVPPYESEYADPEETTDETIVSRTDDEDRGNGLSPRDSDLK